MPSSVRECNFTPVAMFVVTDCLFPMLISNGVGAGTLLKTNKSFGDYTILALSFGLTPSGGIYMQFERGKPPETPNAPYRAACMKDKRWRSA
jgi:hypothetical protein